MKKISALAMVAAAALGVAGCSGTDQADYDVSGVVESRWIDYECAKAAGEFRVELTATSSGSSGSRSGGTKQSGGTEQNGSTSGGSSGSGRTSKPVTKVPTGKPVKPKNFDSKRCTEEPEVFVKNADGVFEVDVTRAVYEACAPKEKFPSCADS